MMAKPVKTVKLHYPMIQFLTKLGITRFLSVSTLMELMIISCHPILETSALRALSTDSASHCILLHLCMSTLLVSCFSVSVSFVLPRHCETEIKQKKHILMNLILMKIMFSFLRWRYWSKRLCQTPLGRYVLQFQIVSKCNIRCSYFRLIIARLAVDIVTISYIMLLAGAEEGWWLLKMKLTVNIIKNF